MTADGSLVSDFRGTGTMTMLRQRRGAIALRKPDRASGFSKPPKGAIFPFDAGGDSDDVHGKIDALANSGVAAFLRIGIG